MHRIFSAHAYSFGFSSGGVTTRPAASRETIAKSFRINQMDLPAGTLETSRSPLFRQKKVSPRYVRLVTNGLEGTPSLVL